jgi:hypothetical protein
MRSPRQPAGTRRGQDRPLPSPSVPPSTLARHPAVPAKTRRGVAHPSVPRHIDGAHEQDQPHHRADHHIANLNDGHSPRGRYPERRSTVRAVSPAAALTTLPDWLRPAASAAAASLTNPTTWHPEPPSPTDAPKTVGPHHRRRWRTAPRRPASAARPRSCSTTRSTSATTPTNPPRHPTAPAKTTHDHDPTR